MLFFKNRIDLHAYSTTKDSTQFLKELDATLFNFPGLGFRCRPEVQRCINQEKSRVIFEKNKDWMTRAKRYVGI